MDGSPDQDVEHDRGEKDKSNDKTSPPTHQMDIDSNRMDNRISNQDLKTLFMTLNTKQEILTKDLNDKLSNNQKTISSLETRIKQLENTLEKQKLNPVQKNQTQSTQSGHMHKQHSQNQL